MLSCGSTEAISTAAQRSKGGFMSAATCMLCGLQVVTYSSGFNHGMHCPHSQCSVHSATYTQNTPRLSMWRDEPAAITGPTLLSRQRTAHMNLEVMNHLQHCVPGQAFCTAGPHWPPGSVMLTLWAVPPAAAVAVAFSPGAGWTAGGASSFKAGAASATMQPNLAHFAERPESPIY